MKTTSAIALGFIAAAAANPLRLNTRASSGCGKPHNSGFNSNPASHTITSGGRDRTYAVRVPDGYNDDPNKPRKVIFDFHGRLSNPEDQYKNSQYDKYDAGKEYLAVYPAGVNKSWQGAPYAAKGVDDVLFVKDLLARMREQYCIDDNHVYASGKSNGGGFVDTLACSDEGDEFAAFAMAAAALYDDTSKDRCNKKRAILEAHGGDDKTIPYGGGPTKSGGDVPDVDEWVTWWGQRDGCAADAGRTTQHDGYETTTFACNGLRAVVKHYKIDDLGHCWPSSTGDNSDGSRDYCGDHSLDFTPRVLNFFGTWNLTNAPKN
jgi:poly(3-hydroxybutyrate) depolymerase